jgi:hypothetical protein
MAHRFLGGQTEAEVRMTSVILSCCGEVVVLQEPSGEIICPLCDEAFDESQIRELVWSQAPMLRPIFEEPTSEIEREDPWSGPKGFILGGWSLPTKSELATQYLEAADLIVSAIKDNVIEDYRVANPVLFLYRHAVEVALKGIMRSAPRTHDLGQLADAFNAFIADKCGQVSPRWVTARLKEIAAIDPGSTAFRYADYTRSGPTRAVLADSEIYIDLCHLQRSIKVLLKALENIATVASRRRSDPAV